MGTGKSVAILATGSAEGGGSGARELLNHPSIRDRVAALVTNYPDGGVVHLAASHPDIALRIWPNFPKRGKDGFTPEQQVEITQMYLGLVRELGLDYIFLSGWVKQILGLEANKVVNIHPGPLGEYGGEKMYGDHVHEKVWRDYFDGKIVSSAVTMHFVPSGPDDKMDTGPIIVQVPVSLVGCTSQADVKKRVNEMEHKIQWQITEHVMNGKITWSGLDGEPVQFDKGLTIDIDGVPFALDGKLADLTTGLDG